MFVKIKKKLLINDNIFINFQRGDKLVVIVVGILEWKINLIVFKFGFGNRNRCFENRVGVVCFIQNLRMGGFWNFLEKKLYINVLELKVVQFVI